MIAPCYFLHYLVSSFAIISLGNKESWLLYLHCLLISFDRWCSVSLSRGAKDLATVCDFGVSRHVTYFFHVILLNSIFKNPHCKHHPHGSVVSKQDTCFTMAVLLR